jgi:hypothetical protein
MGTRASGLARRAGSDGWTVEADGRHVSAWGPLTLVLHGPPPRAAEAVAAELRARYLEQGELAAADLDAVSVALFDGQAGRGLLFRGLGGPPLYYRAGGDGFRCDTVPSRLAGAGDGARLCRDALPAFFLFGRTPGRDTLFDGCRRLLPGEEAVWDGRPVRVRQRRCLSDLCGTPARDAEGAGDLVDTLRVVLADLTAGCPEVVTLLDGTAASVCVQALRHGTIADELPATAALAVDRPFAWATTDAGVRAAGILGTRHRLLTADDPCSVYLLDAVADGEAPADLRAAYLARLARGLRDAGHSFVLLPTGAEGLIPPCRDGWLRRLLTSVSGRRRDTAARQHLVEDLFGRAAVAEAVAEREAVRERVAGPGASAHLLRLADVVTDAGTTATAFLAAGCTPLLPFLDPRLLRLAVNRRPSADPLPDAARRLAPAAPAVAAPDFDSVLPAWLAPAGPLGPLVADIDPHDFLDASALARLRARPGGLLFTLLAFDVWHKHFLGGS